MVSQKRKRGQLAIEPEEVVKVPEETEEEQLERERSVWEAFREEHFEAIEQLPLTLHRQYTLLEELDRQVNSHTAGLLAGVKAYIEARSKLRQTMIEEELPRGNDIHTTDEYNSDSLPEPEHTESKSTRALLSEISSLTDNYVRASEEKVNVAEAAYNSVDRQVRMLEQAIREQQQAMIKSGVSPDDEILNITPATWIPPVVVEPKKDNTAGTAGGVNGEDEQTIDTSKGKKRKGKPKANAHETDAPAGPKLTLLLSPAAADAEETYCFCNRGSFGEMIACDNDGRCKRAWFHLECLGLKEAPPEEESYYCPECLPHIQPQKGKPRSTPRRKR